MNIHSCLVLPLQYKTSNSHYLCLFVETPINLRCLLIKALHFPATAKLCVSPVPEASSLLGLWSFFWREAIMWEEPWETQVHSSDHQLPSCPFALYEFIGFSFLLRTMNALYICSNFSHNSVLQIWHVIYIYIVRHVRFWFRKSFMILCIPLIYKTVICISTSLN